MQTQSINWSFLDPSYTAAYFTTQFIKKTPLITKIHLVFSSIVIANVLVYNNFIPLFIANLHLVGAVVTTTIIVAILHSILQGVFIKAWDHSRSITSG